MKVRQSGFRIVDEIRPRPFRKYLIRGLRDGLFTLRFYGESGQYRLGIQRGNTIWRISPEVFAKPVNVLCRGFARFKVKAKQYRKAA